jgi:hypothetical protein
MQLMIPASLDEPLSHYFIASSHNTFVYIFFLSLTLANTFIVVYGTGI